MGEQNRRAVEGEGAPADATRPDVTQGGDAVRRPDDDRALGVEADERQTRRQAPDGASPGEGDETDSIG